MKPPESNPPFVDDPRPFARGDEVELGHDLAASMGADGDVVQSEDRVWQYNGATWTKREDADLKKQAHNYAGRFVIVPQKQNGGPDGIVPPPKFRPVSLSAGNVRGIVQTCKDHLHQPDFFSTAPVGIPFRNVFARVDGKGVRIEPLTRGHRVKQEHCSPFDLDVMAGRPVAVDRLLDMAWGNCSDADDRIRFFWEWLGAALAGIATRYKDTPILYGPKDTGKSQILHVVTCVFPVTSHRAITLQNMASEYHRAFLSGGRINSVNELPARELLDGEAAKAILSGDVVNCRRPRENPFDWLPRCAHIFSCNGLPPSRDDALMDRFALLECANVIADEDKDRDLAAKISAEAPQIAAAALAALADLLQRGHLIRPVSSADLTSEWRTQSDPVHAWARECLSQNDEDGASTKASDLFADFRAYAIENGNAQLSMVKFAMRMKAMGFTSFRSDGMRWRASLIGPARAEAQARWRDNGNSNRYGSD